MHMHAVVLYTRCSDELLLARPALFACAQAGRASVLLRELVSHASGRQPARARRPAARSVASRSPRPPSAGTSPSWAWSRSPTTGGTSTPGPADLAPRAGGGQRRPAATRARGLPRPRRSLGADVAAQSSEAGVANAIGQAIDESTFDEQEGTLAGDNTILVLFADEARLEAWLERFEALRATVHTKGPTPMTMLGDEPTTRPSDSLSEPLKILVVDDEPAMVGALGALLGPGRPSHHRGLRRRGGAAPLPRRRARPRAARPGHAGHGRRHGLSPHPRGQRHAHHRGLGRARPGRHRRAARPRRR